MICSGCSNQHSSNIPEHFGDIPTLTVYSADVEPAYQFKLERELSFGDTEEVQIGNPGQLEVDNSGTVYIGDTQLKSVHVFQPDGTYLTSIGREGEGPGEFQWIGTMQIQSEKLFIYDPNSRRINAFRIPESLDENPIFSHSISLTDENFREIPGENFMSPGLYRIRNDGAFILSSRSSIFMYRVDPDFQGHIRYYLVNMEDNTSADFLFEMNMPEHIVTEWFTIPPPFYGRGLLALSSDDRIFSVWTDDILIKVHSVDGVYERSFYYPFANRELNREDAINSVDNHEQLHDAVGKMRLPETWPALNRMFIDDENRIWIAAILDDPEMSEWWVMNDEGELITRFMWPRNQSIILVRDNHLYILETEEDTGLQTIVRYRIEMDQNHRL